MIHPILPPELKQPGGGGRSGVRRLLGHYARFCVVGATGMVVDMGMLHLLVSPALLGWNLSLSKAVAAETALLNNFVWNELWTFRPANWEGAARQGRWWERLLTFNLICVAGIGWSVLLLNLQVHWMGWNVYLSNLIAIMLVSLWNFWLSLRFGWKLHPPSNRTTSPGERACWKRTNRPC